jgi:RsiW-degrading membrane proteinase PrsW (M82 family)
MTAQPTPVVVGPSPRWGDQTGFVQRHQPAFWLFVVILGITSLDFLSQQLQMISAEPTAWLITVILLVPYAIPVIALIYYLDLFEREPISILVAALLWGGIAATTLSMYTNTPLMEVVFKVTGDPNFTNEWAAALTAPFVEELFKGLAVVLLVAIARNELDDVLDGFVWGAMVGIGFLLVEDVIYFVRAASDSGSIASVFQMFMIRILGAGPYSHFLYTGLVGMGLAYFTVRRDKPEPARLVTSVGLIAAGVGAHFFWNSPLLSGLLGDGDSVVGWLVYVTVKGLPMLIGLILVVQLARQRERRWFAALTSGFADDGSITPGEVTELSGLRSRRRARNAAARERGPRGRQLKGRLQREQIGLAMMFSKYGSEGHPAVAQQMARIAALRAEDAALGSTPGTPAAPLTQPAPGWSPTHSVPDGGLSAWSAPNPALAPVVALDPLLELVVVERAGDWARVMAVNGWSGWVDGRRLVARR